MCSIFLFALYLCIASFVLCDTAEDKDVDDGVAIIDISPLLFTPPLASSISDSFDLQVQAAARYTDCVNEILVALEDKGLFLATHFGWSDEFIEEAFDASHALFALSEEELVSVKMDDKAMRGYIPFGQESGLKDTVFEPKEGYAMGFNAVATEVCTDSDTSSTCTAAAATGAVASYLRAANIWPATLSSSYRSTLDELYERKVDIATRISRAILEVSADTEAEVGVEAAEVDSAMWGGAEISVLRLFHYLKTEPEPEKESEVEVGVGVQRSGKAVLGSSAHTDWGLLTVILQDGAGGLEYLHDATQQWRSVAAQPRTLVINGGDFLQLLRPRLVSPIHRVLCPTTSDRTSFVFFFYPAYDVQIPSPPLVGKAPTEGEGVSGRRVLAQGQVQAKGTGQETFNTLLVYEQESEQDQDQDQKLANIGGSMTQGLGRAFGPYIEKKWNSVR